MNSIIEMNNLAVLMTEDGRYMPSTKILRTALLSAEAHMRGESDDIKSAIPRRRFSLGGASNSLPSHKVTCHSFSTEQDCMDGSDFVYRYPVHIPQNGIVSVDFEDSKARRLDEYDVNCILLFNMALAHHLAALELSVDDKSPLPSTSESSKLFRKALKFYEMSFTLQADLGTLNLTQTLALVNNCASIYKRLDKAHRAKRFYQHMLTTLMTMIEMGETSEVEQLDGFLYNICTSGLILKEVAAPAA